MTMVEVDPTVHLRLTGQPEAVEQWLMALRNVARLRVKAGSRKPRRGVVQRWAQVELLATPGSWSPPSHGWEVHLSARVVDQRTAASFLTLVNSIGLVTSSNLNVGEGPGAPVWVSVMARLKSQSSAEPARVSGDFL